MSRLGITVEGSVTTVSAWWELAIPIGGTLLGALTGSWMQGRNGIRLLKAQNTEALRADADKYKHERAMQLLEDKRKQYAEFYGLVEKWGSVNDGDPTPFRDRSSAEREKLDAVFDELDKSFRLMYFIASPEVFASADDLFMSLMQGQEPSGPLMNHFIKMTREDLGVGGQIPPGWSDDALSPGVYRGFRSTRLISLAGLLMT